MSNRTILPSALLLLALGTAACSGGGAGSAASGDPSESPEVPAATPSGIAHPTGPDEIILRYDQAGGFVPIEFIASHVPIFTLYGDGRVVLVSDEPVEWQPNQPMVGAPILTGVLDEAQIQGLLEYALSDGGLAIARERYDNQMVADASTAVFEINAAGDSKKVEVYALGMDAEPGADSAVKAQLAALADRLRNLDQAGGQPYVADAYRGVLMEAGAVEGVVVRDWPWPDIAPADFTFPPDPNALQQGTRVLNGDEAAAIGVDGHENGIQSGLYLKGPDGKVYSFVLRPLLPDEEA